MSTLAYVVLPWKWPEGVLNIVGHVGKWVFNKAVNTYKALPRPKSFLGKCITEPIYIWIAIPGTVPYTLFEFGKLIGFEAELMEAWNSITGFLGGTGYILLDLLGKAVLLGLAALVKVFPLLGMLT